jgi:hypothetical protein
VAHGRTIRIYLADGSASGIRHAEVVNWTGQAIVCPRGRVGELGAWAESQRPGVYMLVGDDPKGSKPLAYVGEAENVLVRLKTHLKDSKKDFWDQVVFFTSKDENLTKSHVKYLEARIIALASEVGRVTLSNGTAPNPPLLPRADRDAMEEFLGPARLLLAALGFTALQSLAKKVGSESDGPSGPLADVLLHCVVPKRGIDAKGHSTDEGFVVLEGSLGDAAVRKSLSNGWRKIREELIAEGSIVATTEGGMRFARDVLFKSPSAASSIVTGGTWGGRTGWRDASGKTLADLEGALVANTGGGAEPGTSTG